MLGFEFPGHTIKPMWKPWYGTGGSGELMFSTLTQTLKWVMGAAVKMAVGCVPATVAGKKWQASLQNFFKVAGLISLSTSLLWPKGVHQPKQTLSKRDHHGRVQEVVVMDLKAQTNPGSLAKCKSQGLYRSTSGSALALP